MKKTTRRTFLQMLGLGSASILPPTVLPARAPGEFTMRGDGEYTNNYPGHRVKITKGFWLLETEVTQEMWMSVMGKNPNWFRKGLLVLWPRP